MCLRDPRGLVMGIVSASRHRGKHASWLTGYVCLAWGQHTVRVGGWDRPVRSGDWGSHPGCTISCLCDIGRPQTPQLKPRGLKQKNPESDLYKLSSSLVVWFLNLNARPQYGILKPCRECQMEGVRNRRQLGLCLCCFGCFLVRPSTLIFIHVFHRWLPSWLRIIFTWAAC